MSKEKKLNLIFSLVILAIFLLLFQGIYLLIPNVSEMLYQEVLKQPTIGKLISEQNVGETEIIAILRFIAFMWLACAVWLILALTKIKDKEKNVFPHLIIPSFIALLFGRWLAGICGIIASIIYKKS